VDLVDLVLEVVEGLALLVEDLGVADQPGAVLGEDPLRPPLGEHLGGDGGGLRP